MKKEKKDVILELCGYLRPGVYYTGKVIKTICKDNKINTKNIFNEIHNEYYKSESLSRIIYVDCNGISCFSLNPKIDFSRERELCESKTIIGMAQTISKIIDKQNKKTILDWINNQFENKLQTTVQDFVSKEFQNEILPVLKQHISIKLSNIKVTSKEQVKVCIKEVLREWLTKIIEENRV